MAKQASDPTELPENVYRFPETGDSDAHRPGMLHRLLRTDVPWLLQSTFYAVIILIALYFGGGALPVRVTVGLFGVLWLLSFVGKILRLEEKIDHIIELLESERRK